MLVSIYTAIETKLKASATFAGYNFFRHYSKKAAGKQTKARVPFMSLTFDEEISQQVKQHGIRSRATFTLVVRWGTAHLDLDAIGRMAEFSARKTAVLKALLGSTDEEFLDLRGVSDLSVSTEQTKYGISTEEIIDNGLKATITVDYFEGR